MAEIRKLGNYSTVNNTLFEPEHFPPVAAATALCGQAAVTIDDLSSFTPSAIPTIMLLTMTPEDLIDILPDVRDGLNRKERAILYCLKETQEELRGRNVPTLMLYGRATEYVDISQAEFQEILQRLVGFGYK